MTSPVIIGREYEFEVVTLLRSSGMTCKHIGGRGDKGIDIRGEIRGTKFVVQCKRWNHPIGPIIIREMKGVLAEEQVGTIGIVVAPYSSAKAIETARLSVFPIIVTDKAHIEIYILHMIIDFLKKRPFKFIHIP
ncbi:hypothetical protein Glove_186g144 [Diversispora epigaea]|uniref:Restriction endonuclease type IV Mrr domain-containing protein n=1 Tax=Diversispora epigaea TaxID=1348612 RepID=A0A397IM19_9GLOM|nr:hypothetical protein Glove_186g144 [Diversispora epigaea]